MAQYAMLVLPAANRVYAEAAPDLLMAELEVFNSALFGGALTGMERTDIAGVPYVTFEAPELTEKDTALLANASSLYALFRTERRMLAPVELARMDRFDDDLITIPKYQGKTNEHFTKLLLNVTLLASDFAGQMLERQFAVVDPLCGRGTTLNQALMYGFDTAGIDLDKRDFRSRLRRRGR